MAVAYTEMLFASARKNSTGVANRRPVRRATVGVKVFGVVSKKSIGTTPRNICLMAN